MILVSALAAPVVLASPAAAAGTFCGGQRATIVGTAGYDVIRGTSGDDVINARSGSDVVYGGSGRDIICGGPGADHLIGGPGNDRLYGNLDAFGFDDEQGEYRVGDTLVGGAGSDRVSPGIDTRLPADTLVLDTIVWWDAPRAVLIDLRTGEATGFGHDHFTSTGAEIVGSNHGDRIIGSAAADNINGWRGSDAIYAGPGDDQIVPDGHPGQLVGAADKVIGGLGDDDVTAVGGRDYLSGGPGDDTLRTFAPTPVGTAILGGGGNDFIYYTMAPAGSAGDVATLAAGDGHDVLSLSTRTSVSATGSWNMSSGAMIFTVTTPLTLEASGFEDGYLWNDGVTWTITGTDADNLIHFSFPALEGGADGSFTGLGGNDTFQGGPRADTFNGGPGSDRSLGMGTGDDTCIAVETFDLPDCEHIVG